MLSAKSSRGVIRWLTLELGATRKRHSRHGDLYVRTCPVCKRMVRITVPLNRERILDGTLDSICRQAHVSPLGAPDCPIGPGLGSRG